MKDQVKAEEGPFPDAVAHLRRFPATEGQRAGIEAAIVWLEVAPEPTSSPAGACDHWWETSGYPGGTTSRCSRYGATSSPGIKHES